MKNRIIYTDCDGVLLDWFNSASLYFARMHGLEYQRPDIKRNNYCLTKTYKDVDKERSARLVEEFNSSEYFGRLGPCRDSVSVIRKMHETHGFSFHVISKVGGCQNKYNARWNNLKELFGSAIIGLDVVHNDHEKEVLLKEYKTSHDLAYPNEPLYWIEDLPANAKMGKDLGYKTILVRQDYNLDVFDSDSADYFVANWNQINNIIALEISLTW